MDKDDKNNADTPESQGFLGGLRAVLGARSKRAISEEEIKTLVDDNDNLLDDEKRMIGEILHLDELTVSDIMQPRVDMIAAQDSETVRAVLDRMQGTGYSRLPVYHEDLDHVIGIAHYKDLVPVVLDDQGDDSIADHVYEPLFVPETKDLFPLLSEMQAMRQQMAIVVDEYGGTDGVITIEDIVEEIVGEILDETDSEHAFLSQLAPNEWNVDGRCPVEDVMDLGWPVTESDEYETIAGWLMDAVDAVPQIGDEFQIEDVTFKVLSMRRRRIQGLRVKKVIEDESATDGQE